MAVQVHVAELGIFKILSNGRVVQTGGRDKVTIKESLNFDTQFRVIVSSDNTNTDNNPTIKAYLELEAADGFEPVQVFQTMIITKKVT